jgi:hypothetical protein
MVTVFSQPSLITCLLPPSYTGITTAILGPPLNTLVFCFRLILNTNLPVAHQMFNLLGFFKEYALKKWYKIYEMARKFTKLGNCESDIIQHFPPIFYCPSVLKMISPHFDDFFLKYMWSS